MESSGARCRSVKRHSEGPLEHQSQCDMVCSEAPDTTPSSTVRNTYLLKTQTNNFIDRKYIIILIVLMVLIGFTILYNNQKEPSIMHFGALQNNISCHLINDGDVLPSAEDASFSPKSDSIFFHETSCRGGINSRQACAVESAARAHPTREVYVLFSSPVSHDVYYGSCIAKLRNSFPNVRFARVHIDDYGKNTPLESLFASKPFKNSYFLVELTADVLRFLTLWKWGGIYLDTDIMVVKPLTPLGSTWAGTEGGDLVGVSAIAISMDPFGRKFADDLVNEIIINFNPEIWTHMGPGVMTRVLRRRCNTAELLDWSAETCQGLQVYSREYFYPIHYSWRDNYFKPGDIEFSENTYTHHFWNHLTRDQKIEKDSLYAMLAKQFCPTIYEMYGDQFGE